MKKVRGKKENLRNMPCKACLPRIDEARKEKASLKYLKKGMDLQADLYH